MPPLWVKNSLPVDDTPPPRNGGEAMLNACVRIGVLTMLIVLVKGFTETKEGQKFDA